jgi:hypothetical protein
VTFTFLKLFLFHLIKYVLKYSGHVLFMETVVGNDLGK